MSILGSNSNSGNVGAPFFQEFKKQASFFLKEKIKTARLALTDVTPAQLLAEEATNGNPGGPDPRILKILSKAAFEVDDYWRIVEILHKRLTKFDKRNWRVSYNALILLDHLLTHGPESVADEFQSDKGVIREMGNFQHIEKGFNWGLNVRKKSERILKLLENGTVLKEERNRARKVTRGIEGFGSFCQRTSSGQVLQESSSIKTYGRCNSQLNDHGSGEDIFSCSKEDDCGKTRHETFEPTNEKTADTFSNRKMENSSSWTTFSDQQVVKNTSTQLSFKENRTPKEQVLTGDWNEWNCRGESNPLLGEEKADCMTSISGEDHPLGDAEHLTTVSLLGPQDRALQAC